MPHLPFSVKILLFKSWKMSVAGGGEDCQIEKNKTTRLTLVVFINFFILSFLWKQ